LPHRLHPALAWQPLTLDYYSYLRRVFLNLAHENPHPNFHLGTN